MKKLISMLFIVIILTLFCFTIVQADPVTAMDNQPTANSAFLNNLAGKVLRIVQIIGAGAATIMLVVIAIKFMTAAPAEKADVKKQLIGYVVGVIILVALIGLLQIVSAIGTQITRL